MTEEPKPSWIRQAFSDETGWISFARIALGVTLLFTFLVVREDVWGAATVPVEVYAILTTIITLLAVWAAGNRGIDTAKGIFTDMASMVKAWREK